MQQEYRECNVIENKSISDGIYKLKIEGKFNAKPGQFYMLRAWGVYPLLPRPISIYDIDDESISFLYEVKGEGTKIFKDLNNGDKIGIAGPLGNGFDVSIKGKVAVVTGGIGIAPMKYVIKELKNAHVHLFSGFRDETYLIDEFENYVEGINITTDSGRFGHKGFVTDIFDPSQFDCVLCCGPEIMMKRVVNMCKDKKTPVYISMEKHMACGIGACLVCTCKTKDGNKRTCKDGPVFSGEDVIFDA